MNSSETASTSAEPARAMSGRTNQSVAETLDPLVKAIIDNDSAAAGLALRSLLDVGPALGWPRRFLEMNTEALDRGEWAEVGRAFANREFIGDDRAFIIAAPYATRRGGKAVSRLGLIAGRALNFEEPAGLQKAIVDIFGDIRQAVPSILPFEPVVLAGAFGGEACESFVVPDGFPFLIDNHAALNNVDEQMRRLTIARRCIRRIFEPSSANLLLRPLLGRLNAIRLQFHEYSFHEAGHAAGIGLNAKIAAKVFSNNPHYAGEEEYRADGVAFELAHRLLPQAQAAELISSNLVTRFGLDAHRAGTIERDTDVECAFFTFVDLLEASAIDVRKGKLVFVDPSPEGLSRATGLMRVRTVDLTRRELRLQFHQGLGTLFGAPKCPGARVLFDNFIVNPCRGMYRELQ